MSKKDAPAAPPVRVESPGTSIIKSGREPRDRDTGLLVRKNRKGRPT